MENFSAVGYHSEATPSSLDLLRGLICHWMNHVNLPGAYLSHRVSPALLHPSLFTWHMHLKHFFLSPGWLWVTVITGEQIPQFPCQRKGFHPPNPQGTRYIWFPGIRSLLLYMYLFLGPFRGHTEEPIFWCGVVFYYCDHYGEQVASPWGKPL